jgi:predicted DNA-binding protein
LPAHLKEQVKAMAKAEGRKVTGFVKAAIRAKLERDENFAHQGNLQVAPACTEVPGEGFEES